jgi:diguanylate cyclase (GGDEF)-like protein
VRIDVPALTERLHLLQLVRALVAAATVAFALVLPGRFTVGPAAVAVTTALLLATTTAVELARRNGRLTVEAAVRTLLLADAAFLALTTAWSGQATSPLLPSALLELVAVTILLSWRAGVEAALFDSLAFAGAHAGVLIGVVPGTGEPVEIRSVAAVVLAFGACTALTAACSSYDRRALRQSRRHFQALSRLALALEHQAGTDTVSSVLADHLGRHLGFPRVAVLVPSPHATLAVTWMRGQLTCADLPSGLVDDPLVRPALRDHEPVLRPATDVGSVDSVVARALPGAAQVAVVAMRTTGDELGGVVAVAGTGARALTAGAAEVLRQAAAHGASALRVSGLLAELERRAARDPLTGLANRRSLDDHLDRELSRSRREGLPLSLILFDLDHFKAINDEHGHQVGDQVLHAVARSLAVGVRDVDLPARYGGEEFVVLLPGTTLPDAVLTADRLRYGIADAGSPLPVTISAGVASFPQPARTGAELLALADAALYEAKRSGRDRVVTAPTAARPAAAPAPVPARARSGAAPRRSA